MDITGIIWLRSVIHKLAQKHQVDQVEVEQVFSNRPQFRRVARGNVAGEDLYTAMAQADSGRYLIVFFIYKLTHEALVSVRAIWMQGSRSAMAKSKAMREPIPEEFATIDEAAEFWDTHSLADYSDLTEEADFVVNLWQQRYLVALAPQLAEKLAAEAHKQGLSTETLVNLWLSEKLQAANA